VIAVTSSAGQAEELGADEVVTSIEEVDEPVDLVLDNVGGPGLVAAWERLAPGGSVQCIGWSSGEPATFPPYAMVATGRSLSSFVITGPVGTDLANLVRMVEQRSLRVEIGWRGPLTRVADAVQALRDRQFTGKAVLDVLSRKR
jgi:NADPH:quinone reductase